MPETKDFLSIKELVARTGLSRPTLYRHARSGALPLVKSGRRTLIRVADYERWRDALVPVNGNAKPSA